MLFLWQYQQVLLPLLLMVARLPRLTRKLLNRMVRSIATRQNICRRRKKQYQTMHRISFLVVFTYLIRVMEFIMLQKEVHLLLLV